MTEVTPQDQNKNIQILLDQLSEGKEISVIVKISEYFDTDTLDHLYVFYIEPKLPILGESERFDFVQDQAIKAIQFFFKSECKSRGIEYNFDKIHVEFDVIA